ncbi:haloacid dehalogenase-like hydrolase [Legionella tunisiensis]|uniref:haloacid dehalogenase-like hydrolase n=1 Tax=Legionella tunisiensis TaxID=1034944 RepID=UPI000A01ED13
MFISQVLVGQLRQEAIARLRYHQQQRHVCIVVSGAWDIYLKPWAKLYGVNHVLCTELEFDPMTNKSTGRMSKQYCLGPEKLHRFKKLYANRDEYILLCLR